MTTAVKRKGPRVDSLARRVLQHLHDDGGIYSIPVIAEDLREDREAVMYAVCGMVHLGRVDATRRSGGSLYEISAEGREWLDQQKEKTA